jgi:hypothetical protein
MESSEQGLWLHCRTINIDVAKLLEQLTMCQEVTIENAYKDIIVMLKWINPKE